MYQKSPNLLSHSGYRKIDYGLKFGIGYDFFKDATVITGNLHVKVLIKLIKQTDF